MTKISLAPLQGFTNYHFRNAFKQCFSGVDRFYAPWLRLDGKGELKKSQIRDIAPENNEGIALIPQIMCNNSKDFIFLSHYLENLGYEEINWNLGCPYPMITKRNLGSALLSQPEEIIQILEESLSTIKAKISLKMRLGFEDPQEILKLLPLLDSYPLSEIIIHARTADQKYKGKVNLDAFSEVLNDTKHRITYNGDLSSLERYQKFQNRFPELENLMIGRGLIGNPFLAEQIQQKDFDYSTIPQRFNEFHELLMERYANHLSGDKHLLIAMKAYWEYFSILFEDSHKAHKRIKKAKSMKAYHEAVKVNLNSSTE